jgi:hypothetical protein
MTRAINGWAKWIAILVVIALAVGGWVWNAAQGVWCTFSVSGSYTIYTDNLTTTGFTPQSDDGAKACYWVAIGY